jgi:bifunctional non-homologous end joining protein LigD
MPVPWTQVRTGLNPKHFTISTVPALWKRSSAWQGYDKSERSLENAIRQLTSHKQSSK